LVIGSFPDPLQRGGEPLGHAVHITFVGTGLPATGRL
jgi:hypothetical protein